MKNLSPIAIFLLSLAKKANRIMLKHYSPLGIKFQNKADLSPVTVADLEINRMVIREVKKYYPDYDVLAEEISTNQASSKKLFVVDPLDGTMMFAIGAPLFDFSAAVVVNGESLAGVISNPLTKRTLIAEKGKGAYLAETATKISVSQKNTLNKALVNSGWKSSRLSAPLHEKLAYTPSIYAICESGSLVATGGFDGALYLGRFPHDIAALKVIVEEAGGLVTNIYGQNQRYDQALSGAVISNGKLHKPLLKIIKANENIGSLKN